MCRERPVLRLSAQRRANVDVLSTDRDVPAPATQRGVTSGYSEAAVFAMPTCLARCAMWHITRTPGRGGGDSRQDIVLPTSKLESVSPS
jgi:hypothetical protein